MFTVTGEDEVPVSALVRFVRLSHSYDQREVFELLAERVVEAAMASPEPGVRAKGKCLELIMAADSLTSARKRPRTADELGTEGRLDSLLFALCVTFDPYHQVHAGNCLTNFGIFSASCSLSARMLTF